MNDTKQDRTAAVLEALAQDKNADLDEAVELALADEHALAELVAALVSKNEVYRYNCFKVLLQISESQPATLYPEWDTLVGLLDSSNAFHRSASLRIIAGMTAADPEGRFERLFDRYFALLDDEKVMTARYLAQSAGRIARAKPHLQKRIVERLLDIDATHHEPGRKDLIKADIIQSFEAFFEDSLHQKEMRAFTEAQLDCSSPKTRKAAKAFLKRYSP